MPIRSGHSDRGPKKFPTPKLHPSNDKNLEVLHFNMLFDSDGPQTQSEAVSPTVHFLVVAAPADEVWTLRSL